MAIMIMLDKTYLVKLELEKYFYILLLEHIHCM